ncbi:MFS transporter [Corynebacterium sp. 3HC-13]|uniref:MFS transporter n=1 Tax=Corynebacterium poyangense TaxID=2684405 RepID=UPI001CCEFA74|nr:MFS transporter [Corynebacterium poyangense]MBZ8178391.1 MFS transporter [Corynebacterium poyangense]
MAGTIVEWYEFFLYATAATLVFNHLFFPPNDDPYVAIIAAFTTYAIGFIARPLGGIIFAHYGDKYGRKHLLQVAIVMVGATTFLMGCLPGFASIGYWAPALLVSLRFIQGIAVGGEWGGAVLLVAEHAPPKERGFWASWPQAALPLGNLLATVVLMILSWLLSEEQFISWGWRIGFWLSVVIVALGYYIRTKISDAPIFEETKEAMEQSADKIAHGVFEVLRRYPRGVLTAMGMRFGENVLYYMVVTFSITYLSVWVGLKASNILGLILIAHALQFFMVPMVGKLADAIGRKPVSFIGAVLTMCWPFIAFPLLNTGQRLWVLLAIVSGLLAHSFMYSAQPAIMAEAFPTRMRYSGVSMGYQVTSIVAGSLAPIIATELLRTTDSWVPVALYIVFAAAITFVATIVLKETKGVHLEDVDANDHHFEEAKN